MFSRTADYAIRAVLMMARHEGADPLSAEDIATALDLPRNYLGKTLNTLVRHGLLHSARGPRGGFTLAIPPSRLSVADVVDLFTEPRVPTSKCIMSNRLCNPDDPCAAHERWITVTDRARAPLMHTTISELCGSPMTFVPLAPVADHTGARVLKAGRKPIPTGTNS